MKKVVILAKKGDRGAIRRFLEANDAGDAYDGRTHNRVIAFLRHAHAMIKNQGG